MPLPQCVLEQAVDHVADMHGGLHSETLAELAVEWIGAAIIGEASKRRYRDEPVSQRFPVMQGVKP